MDNHPSVIITIVPVFRNIHSDMQMCRFKLETYTNYSESTYVVYDITTLPHHEVTITKTFANMASLCFTEQLVSTCFLLFFSVSDDYDLDYI